MKNMKFIKTMSLAFVALAAAFGAFAETSATVETVLVRQLWPWSRNVRVEYTLANTGGGSVDISFRAYNGSTELDVSSIGTALVSDEGLHGIKGDGIHSFTFDPYVLFGDDVSAYTDFKVSVDIAGEGDPLSTRIEYRVFDLETGAVTTLSRRNIYDRPEIYGSTVITNYADLYTGFAKPAALPAEDVFIVPGFASNDVFKTTKLVMKRIPAAGNEFWMGPSDGDEKTVASDYWNNARAGESRFKAKLSSDFYIGIFELTQKQYQMLTGERPSYYTNETYWTTRPLENTKMETMTAEGGFIALAANLFGKSIALPTEAQWEYAAKALYDGAGYPSGLDLTEANELVMENYVSRGHSSQDDAIGIGGTYTVGLGNPNPFGLYNMYGNATEWTSDYVRRDLASYYEWEDGDSAKVDPVCSSSEQLFGSSYRVFKGGSFTSGNTSPQRRSAYRGAGKLTTVKNAADLYIYGYRLVCPAD